MSIDNVYNALKAIPAADALALGGSRAGKRNDEKSDYDLYVYSDEVIPVDVRRNALESFCSRSEFGNCYFESEDNIVLKDGTPVDIIYRHTEDFEKGLAMMFENNIVRNGYSTCFWHNIRTSEVIFDKSGRYTALVKTANREYPDELAQAIIDRNMALLTGYLPSYDDQIKKAYYRHDYVSVNHRVSAFLESYFDVIFAVNRMTHPGEKRLVEICERECKVLPKNFKENLMHLFEYMFQYDVSDILENIINELREIV